MGLAKPAKRYTPQEYYDLEKSAEYKSDFYRGEIFAMAGGTRRHSRICSNISHELAQHLGDECTEYESNLRVNVKATGLRTYPDASVFCGPMEADAEDRTGQTFNNPTALFEVLSRTTEAYDRGLKCNHYRQIESLKSLILIWPNEPRVELHERQADGAWTAREISGRDGIIPIPSLQIELPLAGLYRKVNFSEPE